MRDGIELASKVSFNYAIVHNDADIARCRGKVSTNFLKAGGDVLFMVDRDISWRGSRINEQGQFERGDLQHILDACLQTKGLVGGVVALKTFGGGVASRLIEDGERAIGVDELHPAARIGGAFIAIHREALERVAETMNPHLEGWFPFFEQYQADHSHLPGVREHLSEDWAFTQRCIDVGVPCHLDMYPILLHHGRYAYHVRDAAQPAPWKLYEKIEAVKDLAKKILEL